MRISIIRTKTLEELENESEKMYCSKHSVWNPYDWTDNMHICESEDQGERRISV